MKKRKDEQYLAKMNAKKARKAAKKRHTEVPGNRTQAVGPNHEDPTKPSRQPSGMFHVAWPVLCFLELWHGGAVPRGTTVPPSFRDAT